MVTGSRFLVGDRRRATARRSRGGSASGSSPASCRDRARRRVTDPTSGLRMTDRRGIELFARDYPHDYPEVEAVAHGHAHRLSARELPVRMRARATGALVDRLDAVGLLHDQGAAGGVRRPAARAPGGRRRRRRPRRGGARRSDGQRAHPDRRRSSLTGGAVLPRLRARAPPAADGALRAAVAVLDGRAARARRLEGPAGDGRDARSGSSTRRRRCSRSRSASSSCCCCTSRWSSRAWPTRTRCSPSSSACCSSASTHARGGRGRGAARSRVARASRGDLTIGVADDARGSGARRRRGLPRQRRRAAARRSRRCGAQLGPGDEVVVVDNASARRHAGGGARRGAGARACSRPARTSASPAAATPARAATRAPLLALAEPRRGARARAASTRCARAPAEHPAGARGRRS